MVGEPQVAYAGVCHVAEVTSEESKRLGAGGSPVLVKRLNVRRKRDIGLSLADPNSCLGVLDAFSNLEEQSGNGRPSGVD